MKLEYDFQAIWQIAYQMGAKRVEIRLDHSGSAGSVDIDEQLRASGIEVEIESLENVGELLSYQGRHVLLYIPDQGWNYEALIAGNTDKGRKFHVAHCSVLEKMRADGKFNKYIATTNVTGLFHVHGIDTHGQTQERKGVPLFVCQVCLKKLNYRQARTENSARRLRGHFDLSDFFETYSSVFPHLPKRSVVDARSSTYSADWAEISQKARAAASWRCDGCGVDLEAHRHLLHVHHRDGVKNNNGRENLRVLCAACHREQPQHDHLFIPRADMKLINGLRKRAGFIENTWASATKFADPACRGVLGLVRAAGWPAPEVEVTLCEGDSAVELAWPQRRYAIALAPIESAPPGWTIATLSEALLKFE